MNSLTITLLGTGTPNLKEEQWGPATLIQTEETNLLIDCGRGTLLRIKQAGVQPETISILFLTHLHSDHLVGLPDLWLTGWEMGRKENLRLWGPEGTESMAYHLMEAFKADTSGRQLEPQCLPDSTSGIDATNIEEEKIELENGLTVTSFKVDHGSFKPALGYRVDYHEISVILSGDTIYSENLVKHSQDVDVLIHNAWMLPDYTESKVLQLVASPEETARVFTETQPRLAVISHYNTEEGLAERISKSYNGELIIGRDLGKIWVDNEKIVYKN